MRTALFIGGTGTISSSLTEILANDDGWQVFLLNRGKRQTSLPPGVESLVADINDTVAVKKILAGRTFDVVANFIAFTPADIQRDFELFSGKTGQYIFISSASAYQKPVAQLPIIESTPLKNPYWEYSRLKIACEDLLTSLYRDKDFPITIIRPSHTYNNEKLPLGIHGKMNNWQSILRMHEGKPGRTHGDGTSLWTLTHSDDFALGMVGLLGNERAIGQAYHITSDDVLTWNQIYRIVADALGVKLNAVHISSDDIARHDPQHYGPLLGDKSHSVIFDNSKIRRINPLFNPCRYFTDTVHDILATLQEKKELQTPDPDFDKWCDDVIASRA